MTLSMTSRVQFESSVRRYSWSVVLAGVAAFALFDGVLFLNLLILRPLGPTLRTITHSWRPVSEIVLPFTFFAASSPVPLLFLWWAVRRARRDPILNCPDCSKFIGDDESAKQIMRRGKCPYCNSELIPNCELDPDVPARRKPTGWRCSLTLCAFGIVLLVYAIPQPRPVQFCLAAAALGNFLVAGYVFLKRNTESNKDAGQQEPKR